MPGLHRESTETAMSTVARLLHVLRRGHRTQKVQAWAGLLLILAALVWLIFNLWIILLLFTGLVLGIYLLVRSLRGSSPPPPSSG